MADVLPHVCSVFEGAVNQLRGVPSGSKTAFKMQWGHPVCWTWSPDVLHALRWMCYVCKTGLLFGYRQAPVGGTLQW